MNNDSIKNSIKTYTMKNEKSKIENLLQNPIVYIPLGLGFMVVTAGIIAYNKLKKQSKLKREINNNIDDINMNDLMNNINKSSELYEQLKRRCHPDRFTTKSDEIQKYADEIASEVAKNRSDYNKLLELKDKAERLLNVKF